ncbi:hypothetical protein [Martelella radicis]|uniref:Uncharacterized protein n=1 Tax=Martelella radicis TaxID=1397476 RepID=A0A7W6KL56_9HYPH|nr:hypothetical protein [Martelella radicis]MBB4123271.1 hypothetical protein [Martelella radicis]
MAKRETQWRKVDVTRAIEAVKAGGVDVGRVEIDGGKIVIVSSADTNAAPSPFDDWLKSNAR